MALDDVSITSLTFGREFTAAIEAKQVAAQEAERAKFVVEKAEQDKRSAIIRAQVSKCDPVLAFSFLFVRLHDFQLEKKREKKHLSLPLVFRVRPRVHSLLVKPLQIIQHLSH